MKSILQFERLLKGLANRRRIAILRYLMHEKEATVNDIADEIKLSVRTTSKHLHILAHLGIVEGDRRSKYMFYGMNSEMHPLAKTLLPFLR